MKKIFMLMIFRLIVREHISSTYLRPHYNWAEKSQCSATHFLNTGAAMHTGDKGFIVWLFVTGIQMQIPTKRHEKIH